MVGEVFGGFLFFRRREERNLGLVFVFRFVVKLGCFREGSFFSFIGFRVGFLF